MRLFGTLIQGLDRVLALHHERHQVLAQNVANAETPGYRARDLDFGDALRRAFDPEGPSGQADAAREVVDRGVAVKIDRNSVDIDYEMARLSDNAMRILALSRILGRKFAGLRRTIEEMR